MTEYNSGSGVIESSSPAGDVKLGYLGTDIKEEYLVSITDKRPAPFIQGSGRPSTVWIRAPLQEKVMTKMDASWSSLSAGSFLSSAANGLSQLISGRSLISRFNSRRIWTGTSPLTFTLSLKFEAINDTATEVTQPVRELQRMILPYSTLGKKAEANFAKVGMSSWLGEFFLAAPGPDPYFLKGAKIQPFSEEGEEINVYIGKLLVLEKVVVTNVTVEHAPRFEKGGASISTVVTITFQTYEILTKETLDNIYPPASAALSTPVSTNLSNESSANRGGFV